MRPIIGDLIKLGDKFEDFVLLDGIDAQININDEWYLYRKVFDINSWVDVQQIVRNGLTNGYFSIGDQLVSLFDGQEVIWNVIGIDHDIPTDSSFTHSMTIQTKDCLEDRVWDAGNDNRYINSDIRAYLNDEFLYKLDPELSAVLGEVNKKVAVRGEIGGQDSFSNKVFLLSILEVDLGTEGVTTGEFVYPYYSGIGNTGRIKQFNGSNTEWWLRSPIVTTSYSVRRVSASGAASSNGAIGTHGVSPACVII